MHLLRYTSYKNIPLVAPGRAASRSLRSSIWAFVVKWIDEGRLPRKPSSV